MNYAYINSIEACPDFIESDNGTLYIDTETFGTLERSALDTLTCGLRLVQLMGSGDTVYIFDAYHVPYERIWSYLANCETLVGHNLSYDLPVLIRHGITNLHPLCPVADTIIGSQVLLNGANPAECDHSLKGCVKLYLERDIVKGHGADNWAEPVLTEEQLQYAAADVHVLRELHTNLLDRLGNKRLIETYQLECRLLPAIVTMAMNGVKIDVDQWTTRSKAAEVETAKWERVLIEALPLPDEQPLKDVRVTKRGENNKTDLKSNERIKVENANRRWNFASHVQVKAVFDKVGVILPDTSYETLIMFTDEHPHIQSLLNFKDKEKEATTFGTEWLKHIRTDLDNRVHPNWRQLGPASGRMACADPNLQQIPRGDCRKGMIAEPGHVLVKADFSQIEARIACKISGDETMLELFRTNRDIHTYAASQVLRKELHEVTKADRQIGKSLVFGLLFGMSAKSLRGYCRINYGVSFTAVEAELFRDRFFNVFKGLKRWHEDAKGRYNSKKEFRTLLGRRRVIINDDGSINRYGLMLNHPVQGTSADMTKASVAAVHERRNEQPGVRLVMIVHDEIVLEAPEDRAEAVGAWLRGIMCEVGGKIIDPVPVDAEVKIGKSWGG